MLILNTGGTFNKRYNPLTGELFVPSDNHAIETIVRRWIISSTIQGIIFKDSLEMDDSDRELLAQTIATAEEKVIIVVHGTDTMDKSAAKVAQMGLDKCVVFTGAMVPFSVDSIEATANLAMAIGYAANRENGVYIVMQGVMGSYDRVAKNKTVGRFDYV
ncbi:MAG: asparaginase domain-containing protein [Sulfuricurvum sp.]